MSDCYSESPFLQMLTDSMLLAAKGRKMEDFKITREIKDDEIQFECYAKIDGKYHGVGCKIPNYNAK